MNYGQMPWDAMAPRCLHGGRLQYLRAAGVRTDHRGPPLTRPHDYFSRSAPMLTSVRSRVATSTSVRPESVSVQGDRKSTRLNSSHSQISYAVFCLKKKKNKL